MKPNRFFSSYRWNTGGILVPSAFTPNHDGRNDVLRALLFGDVKRFEFTICNRWGQVVFTTKDPSKCWDGKDGQMNQNTGVYVWTCTYQFQNEAIKREQGTITVLH